MSVRRAELLRIFCAALLILSGLLPLPAIAQVTADCADTESAALIRSGELTKARENLSARLKGGDASPVEQRLALQASLAETLIELGQFDEAEALIKVASEEAIASPIDACRARVLWTNAVLARNQQNPKQSLQLVEQAFSTLGQSGAHSGLAARLHRNKGNALRDLGEFTAAVPEHEAALGIWRDLHDEWGAAGDAINLSILWDRMGEIGKAIDLAEQAKTSLERLGDKRLLATTLQTLGGYQESVGQYDAAINYTTAALKLHEEYQDAPNQIADLTNLGAMQSDIGHWDDALTSYAIARHLADQIGYSKAQPYILQGFSNTAFYRAYYADAELYALQCVDLATASRDQVTEGFCRAQAGRAATERQELDSALQQFRLALLIGEEKQVPELVSRAAGGMQTVLAMMQRREQAIFFGKIAVNAIQQMRRGIVNLPPQHQQGLVEKNRWIHVRLADLLIDDGRLAEAQQVYSLMKQEEVFEYLRGDRSGSSAEKALSDSKLESSWHRLYQSLAGRLHESAKPDQSPSPPPGRVTAAERESFLKAVDQIAQQPAKDAAPSPSTRSASSSQETKKWQARLTKAGNGSVLIQFLVTGSRLRTLITTPNDQFARSIDIDEARLNALVFAMLQALRDPTTEPRASSQALYTTLIAPLAADLKRVNAKTLWLSLDRSLRYVPFAALYDGHQWLAQSYSSVMLAEAADSSLDKKPASPWHAAGLGVSLGDSEFEPLPYASRELHVVVRDESNSTDQAGIVPGRIYLDRQFNGTAMGDAFSPRYSVVHIASHFRLMPGTEANSFLLLGDRTRLTVKAFRQGAYDLKNLDLLTLSACETALGGTGNEVESFSAVAQLKGARSVMATLWPISDAGTQILMQKFYGLHEQSKLNKAQALVTAQRLFIDGNAFKNLDASQEQTPNSSLSARATLLKHPFFWAPFIIMGSPD